MLPALAALAEGLISAVLPPACAACGRLGLEPFCAACTAQLEDAPHFSVDGLDAARAAWSYGGPAAIAVQRLKYQGHFELARPLGRALAPRVETLGPVDLVVPVPLSRRRLLERGYNQARELARDLGLPVRPRALVRSDAAREQVGLGRAGRWSNLASAFCPGPEPVRGARVLLVDDVVTTGATASAAARALRSAGAVRVVVLALAHAE